MASLDSLLVSLPPFLLHEVISRLPADARARAACVCRAWHVALADPALWTRLDLTRKAGVTCPLNEAALLAAAARAQGRLEALAVGTFADKATEWRVLCAVAAANPSLRKISASCLSVVFREGYDYHVREALQALRAAGPALQALEVPDVVHCGYTLARTLLRNDPPFELVRICRLSIHRDSWDMDMPALASDLVAHPSLTELALSGNFSGAMDAVIDAALRLKALKLHDSRLTPEAVLALARVLCSMALTELAQSRFVIEPPLLDAPSVLRPVLAPRASLTLRRLSLVRIQLWDDVEAGVAVLDLLVGHPSLCFIDLTGNWVHTASDAVTVGAALGALVAADTPAFQELHVCNNGLGDDGLLPLCEALPRNTHLRMLAVSSNGMSASFVLLRLLPAVRANTSLRALDHALFECNYSNMFEFLKVRVAEDAAAADA